MTDFSCMKSDECKASDLELPMCLKPVTTAVRGVRTASQL